jgi:hypothetical protein
MEQNRIDLYQLLLTDEIITTLNYDQFIEKYFSSEESVEGLHQYLLSHISPRENFYYTKPLKDFFKKYACDLEKFKNNNYCTSTPNQNQTEVPNQQNQTPVPNQQNPQTPTPVSGDTSKDSENKMDDPGGGGKIYNIPGDPYKWRIGEDGGWWAKKDSQTQWNNISGRINRGEKLNWKVSVDTMDKEFFDGDPSKRVEAKDLSESITLKLGKFFLD